MYLRSQSPMVNIKDFFYTFKLYFFSNKYISFNNKPIK